MQNSEADAYVFENSVADNTYEPLFQEKKHAFIVDATSNQGQFSGGQVQFNLDTFQSQSQWLDLKEAVIEFPIKATLTMTQAAASGGLTVVSQGVNTFIMKNGFHQMIDSAQLILNGQTIQAAQTYENVAATYRILSSWSQDTLTKWGKSCGIALDDCTGDGAIDTTTNNPINAIGLGSTASTASIGDSVRGFDCVNFYSTVPNKGANQRSKLSNATYNGGVAATLLGTTATVQAGLASTIPGTIPATGGTPGQIFYVQHMLATVRLRDLFDIDQFPLVKNVRGFLYLNVNQFSHSFEGNAFGGTDQLVATVSPSPITGRTCPYLITLSTGTSLANSEGAGKIASAGLKFSTGTSTAIQKMTAAMRVDGTSSTVITGATGTSTTVSVPLATQARMVCPIIVANPRIDSALTMSAHKFNTLDKLVNTRQCVGGESVNFTITNSIRNPKKLVLLPMWCSISTASSTAVPEYSCFDSVPASSGPFCYLNSLQVMLNNTPVFNNPINYDFDMWNQNLVECGNNGGQDDTLSSGLLTQQLWQQNHRYYVIDLSRMRDSEDGSSKSVIATFTNPSSTLQMKVIGIVFYEKKWEIDTSICRITPKA